MEWTGSCLCGAVRFRTSADPQSVSYCHCKMCQRQTGAPVSAAACFPKGTVKWTSGSPKLYVSSPGVERGFCSECGSTLIWQSGEEICIKIGTLDHPESVKPDRHIWVANSLPWLHIDDKLPRYVGGPELPP